MLLLAKIFILPAIVAIFTTVVIYIFMRRHLRYLNNVKKINKIIIKNELYDEKYFPEIYCEETKEQISISIKVDGGKYFEKLNNLGNRFESVFDYELIHKNITNGYVIYRLNKISAADRIYMNDPFDCGDDFKIELSKKLFWDFTKVAHYLLIGHTGSGKSLQLFYLIKRILEKGHDILIIDPKRSKLSTISRIIGGDKVICEFTDIVEKLNDMVNEMNRRYDIITGSENFGFNKKAQDYDIRGYFIVIDEFFALVDGLETKEKNLIWKPLFQLIAKGRESLISVIGASQDLNAKLFDGSGMRSNFGLKEFLGEINKIEKGMMFPGTEKELKKMDRGSGYINIEAVTNEPMQFFAPWFEKDYDFYEDVKKIWEKRKLIDLEKKVS